jgi:hypothetical protein
MAAGMAQCWRTLSLPFPGSPVTQTLFYRQLSALEIEVFNLPLASSDDDLQSRLHQIFSMFGYLDSVSLTSTSKATIEFQSKKGVRRAVKGRRTHVQLLPHATAGSFGIDYFIARYREVHPPNRVLVRVSSDYIRQFEAKEREMARLAGPRPFVRVTEVEKQEIIQKDEARIKKMCATDFYLFQQKDRPNLLTMLLSNDRPAPKHLKKKPKPKRDRSGNPTPQRGE